MYCIYTKLSAGKTDWTICRLLKLEQLASGLAWGMECFCGLSEATTKL